MSLDRGDLAFTPAKENSYFPGLPNTKFPLLSLVGVVADWGVVGSPCWLDGMATGCVGAKVTVAPVDAGGFQVKENGLVVAVAVEPKENAG